MPTDMGTLSIDIVNYFVNIDNGLVAPILTSLLASGVVLTITEVISPFMKYGRLAGTYDIFWIKNWKDGGDEIDFSKPMGEARIRYRGKNKLEIDYNQTRHESDYSEVDNRWKGNLIMETPHNGTIAFYYTILAGKPLEKQKHRIGFKKVICDNKRENRQLIYLIGYRSEGYGKEVLIEKKKGS